MQIALVGLLENGLPQRSGTIINPRTTITIPQGVDLTLKITVQAPDGEWVMLTGSTLIWTAKKKPTDQEAVFAKTATVRHQTATFALDPSDTKNLIPGRFVFDVWLTDALGDRNPVIPLSGLILEAAATLA
jgi:hypothetical protein